jgi:hypothetical protein
VLFVAHLTFRNDLTREQRNEAAQRRSRWKPPPGVSLLEEYWPIGSRYVISILEADSPSALLGIAATWSDVFEVEVYPAVTVSEGLRALQSGGFIRRRGRPRKQPQTAPAPDGAQPG